MGLLDGMHESAMRQSLRGRIPVGSSVMVSPEQLNMQYHIEAIYTESVYKTKCQADFAYERLIRTIKSDDLLLKCTSYPRLESVNGRLSQPLSI